MAPSSLHHLNGNHSDVIPATRSRDCRLKSTAAVEFQCYCESPPQQGYFQQQECPQYQNFSQFSKSDDKLWRDQFQKKSQQQQLSSHTDRRMERDQRFQYHQDERRLLHHQCRNRDFQHRLIFAYLLQPMCLPLQFIVAGTTSLRVKSVSFFRHQDTVSKPSLPFVKTVDNSIQS